MKLKEEIEKIRESEFGITAKLIDLFKRFALGCVGEDVFMENWPEEDNAKNDAKEEIRQRIEEATK